MTYDHVLRKIFNLDPTGLLLFPGRFAFPLFAFMIAWNLAQKDIYAKYIKRLLPFALLTIPIDIYYYHEQVYLNIMVSFILSISLLFGLHASSELKNKFVIGVFVIYLIIFSAIIGVFVDYGPVGIWLIPAIYLFLKKPSRWTFVLALAIFPLLMPPTIHFVLIVPFAAALLLTNPIPSARRSSFKKTGWLYYAYFPLHRLIIGLIAQ